MEGLNSNKAPDFNREVQFSEVSPVGRPCSRQTVGHDRRVNSGTSDPVAGCDHHRLPPARSIFCKTTYPIFGSMDGMFISIYNIDLVDSYGTPLKTKYILIKKWLETYFPFEMVIFTGDMLIFGVYKCVRKQW